MKGYFEFHACQLQPENDDLHEYIKDGRILFLFRRWFRKLFLISYSSQQAQTAYKSYKAIREERQRQLSRYYYVVHPFSKFRECWNFLMIFFVYGKSVLEPLDITFLIDFERGIYFLNVNNLIFFCDCVIALDMVLNFITGFYCFEEKATLMDIKSIATSYFRGKFFTHFLFAVPFSRIARKLMKYEVEMIGPLYSRYALTLVCVANIFRIREVTEDVRNIERLSYSTKHLIVCYRFVAFVVFHGIIVNYLTCLQVAVVFMIHGDNFQVIPSKSWVAMTNYLTYHKRSFLGCYGLCLLHCLGAITANDIMFIEESTIEDCVLRAIELAYGTILSVNALVEVWLVASANFYPQRSMMKVRDQVTELSRNGHLPYAAQRKLHKYFEYWVKLSQLREGHLYRDLSPPLKQEIQFFSSKRMIYNVSFFSDLPNEILNSIIECLRSEIHLPGDLIVKVNTVGSALYFILSGTVAVFSEDGMEMAHLQDGAYFGEIALLTDRKLRTATVVAIEMCELQTLDKNAFRRIIQPYPELFKAMKKHAAERLEATRLFQELEERFRVAHETSSATKADS